MGNGLSSIGALAYQGTNAPTPPNTQSYIRAPTANDYQGFSVGDFWVYRISQTSNNSNLYCLLGKAGNVANWALITGSIGIVETFTGNSGGAVGPDGSKNINLVGDGTTITVVGNPGTNTLTISAITGGVVVEGLHTSDGHTVTPTSGVINISQGTGIVTTGTVGPNTVTVATATSVATSYLTDDTNSAVPAAHVLTIHGGTGITTSSSGSTVTISAAGTNAQSFPTDSGTAIPSSGVLNIKAGVSTQNCGSSVEFTGSGNTVTLNVQDANTNMIIGKGSGNATLTGDNNTVFGSGTLPAVTTSRTNTIFGSGIMTTATSAASGNDIFGFQAYPVGTGSSNLIFGTYAFYKATTGVGNTIIGGGAGFNAGAGTGVTTGSNNILIGYTAGNAYTSSESSNIIIGDTPAVNGESNALRIGFQGAAGASSVTKSFIDGIRGVTTTNNNAIAVLVDSAGQLGTVSSSIRYKENVSDMADSSSALMKLRPVTFNYKKKDATEYGLIAEEVAELFPDLVVYDKEGKPETIKYHILCSILLNEVQKLEKRVKALESKP